MSDFPGSAPPPDGVTPDLENPQDVLRTVMYVTQALTLFFSTLFVALRLYAKTAILGSPWSWDDLTMNGGGINQWEIAPETMQLFLKSGYAATIFYAPMAMSVKLALLLIITRVFGAIHKKTRIGVYILIGIIVAYYTSGVFIKIFICWPIPAYWKGQTEKCLDQSAIITADAIISVISDLVILLLPTPLTWSLQLSTKRRLRIIGMLCAGGIATAFSVYRLILIVGEGKAVNQSIVFTKVVLSGNAEAGIGLICACLPAVNAIFVKVKGSSYYAKKYGNSRSAHAAELGRGEIMMTRSFHVDTSTVNHKGGGGGKQALEESYELGHDQAVLTSNVQANPRSHRPYTSSRRSESTN
ncbi:hypothetical protein ACRE_022690 [Hapsidospora chrysogenum ATCC 11550]|uniref:Rhodopsin domain-containing protein n=1 Tax=Hapsidospora chrysogenum (strain ATCC 11550 / CBS 779.69 / DSM 880 / IAM 14645 / JCM 23072 / IMI 49137) TaxID=857340 RepID=A0A086TC11_HAPC1|nr:hypothetical protein ACRE_022690 [Hapsidospora chrysogenum ATCC 11550]